MIGNDAMHSSYSGMFKILFQELYKPSCNQKYFDTLAWTFLKPEEMHRKIRNFNLHAMFKANEWRVLTLYAAVVLFQDLKDIGDNYRSNANQKEDNRKMLANILLLCSALNLLSSRELTKEKIDFAHGQLNKWHANLTEAFGLGHMRFLAHMHVHYALLSLAHGSVATRTCFQGESAVGFVCRRVHSRENALKQITTRLIKWRRTGLDVNEYENLDNVINEMVKPANYISNQSVGDEFKKGKVLLEKTNFASMKILYNRFPQKQIYVLAQTKLDHFTIKSAHFSGKLNDSLIFMKPIVETEELIPAVVKMLITVDNNIFFVVQILEVKKKMCSLLRWVEDDAIKRLLCNKRFSFPSCFVVGEPQNFHQIIVSSKISTKGFMIIYKEQNYVFPMNSFDHE